MADIKDVKYIVRPIKVSDCEEVEELWKSEGAFLTKYDNQIMMKVDPNGILVAEDLSTGKVIGACAGVNLSPDFAFIGQFIVRRELRNLGIGSEIWRKIMDHIGTDRNIGLYAKPAVFPTYRDKRGFTIIPERKSLFFRGKVDCTQLVEAIDGISVVPISEHNIQKVIQYDRQIHKHLDRSVLIGECAKIPEYVNRVAVNEAGDVLGYCILKVKIKDLGVLEPLYADDEKIAELLLSKCYQAHPISQNNGLLYRCPDTNTNGVAIANKLGMELFRRAPTLFTKKDYLDGDLNRVFCTSSAGYYPY